MHYPMNGLSLELAETDACFSVHSRTGGRSLRNAALELNGLSGFEWDPSTIEAVDELETPLGKLPGVTVATQPFKGWVLTLQAAGASTPKALVLRLQARRTGTDAGRINRYSVIGSGLIATGVVDDEDARTLDGLAGAGDTQVSKGFDRSSPNNLLACWRGPEARWENTVVAGGLTYADFAKYFSTKQSGSELELSAFTEDPVGRLVESGETWSANDWFYLDLWTPDPFEALEVFARTVRAANRADPNPYYFPTVCAWYASVPLYGGGDYINDTPGTVKEVEAAGKAGFLEYCPVAVRLVPDTYDASSARPGDAINAQLLTGENRRYSKDRNTEQGWWDDEHWARFGHYAEPYETSGKWADAVRERGGIPITYVQTGHVSYDYAQTFPGHMLGNDISELDRIFEGHSPYVVFDYTDPDFLAHLETVWTNLGEAGVAGVMFDYPNLGWIETGGFEDPKATTTAAYRNIYKVAKEGLGPESWIQERNVSRKVPYLDATVGLVDSQRVWGDTDGVDPTMYRMCGLRWYKTRTLYSYDTDAKNLIKIAASGRDPLRQVLTLLYFLTGRLLLANSFSNLDKAVVHDLSRLYPAHRECLSPRPVDLFDSLDIPRQYALSFDGVDTHLVINNPDHDNSQSTRPRLFDSQLKGGVGLDHRQSYHVFDFWNQAYLGPIQSSDAFEATLRPAEARVLVFRQVQPNPQVLSTDRHILQGHIELDDLSWDAAASRLSGLAHLTAGETLTLTVALNGYNNGPSITVPDAVTARITADPESPFLSFHLSASETGPVRWALAFSA